MAVPEEEDMEDGFEEGWEHKEPIEGDFDLQLTLPLTPMPAIEPISRIIKRDGRQEAFDKDKIADAIFKAAASIGGQDRNLAMSLASAVTIYLTKRLHGAIPNVDQVHDAVERVLIQMDHFKTALAYVRFRDQRARVRRLREGDTQALMEELEEARAGDREGRSHALASAIQTSNDTLAQWDRGKIVDALCRETGLEQSAAEVIALEVEQQLQQANIKTLTTSLVRELVDARLIAHGLESYRERHRRLGVPLYDLERILRGTHVEVLNKGVDPGNTDRILAGALKKEYALAQVYSPRVVEAHLQGLLQLHDLEQVDRLDSASFFTEPLMESGMPLSGNSQAQADFTEVPVDAMEWLAHWSMANNVFSNCFCETLHWEAFNVVSAAFLRGWSAREIEGFARSLVYECTLQSLKVADPNQHPQCIRLYWRTPAELQDRVLPGNLAESATYAQHQHAAQQLAWALLEVFRQGGRSGIPFPAPRLEIVLNDAFFKTDGHEDFLRHAASVAAQRGNIVFRLERGSSPEAQDTRHVRAHQSCFARVALNLPRIAYEADTEARLWQLLDDHMLLAATALQEKHDFVVGLLSAKGQGALRLLNQQVSGQPWVDMETSVGGIALEGLWDCARMLTQPQSKPDEIKVGSIISLGERMLAYMQQRCAVHSERFGISLRLEAATSATTSKRFVELDLRRYPKSVVAMMGPQLDEKTESIRPEGQAAAQYTSGTTIPLSLEIDTYQRVQLEGCWHPYLGPLVFSVVPLPMADTSEQTVVDFLKKVYYHTETKALSFQ